MSAAVTDGSDSEGWEPDSVSVQDLAALVQVSMAAQESGLDGSAVPSDSDEAPIEL